MSIKGLIEKKGKKKGKTFKEIEKKKKKHVAMDQS